MVFAVMVVGGCANDAQPVAPYDDVAEVVGAQLRTPGGGGELAVLTDVTTFIYGSYPTSSSFFVTHDDITYQYQVRCFDSPGSPGLTSCRAPVNRAEVSVLWGGQLAMPRFEADGHHRVAGAALTTQRVTWTFDNLRSPRVLVTGRSESWFDTTFAPATSDARSMLVQSLKDVTVVWEPTTNLVRGGSQTASIAIVQYADDRTTELTGAVVFERSDRATLTLDDRMYWIDLATGATTISTDGELY